MFKTLNNFVKALFSIPFGWRMWLILLMLINMVIPLIFIQSPEAQITLLLFFVSFVIGLTLFRYQGFTRLLGLMHAPWFLLIYYLIGTLGQTSLNSFFGTWIRAVILLNGISLILDTCNVFRYITGERESIIGL